ncbi:MAG TPA: ABC transporter permease [Mycobacteriales bacterium]|nr:ABC transporter permease [Mycobacteriales bacterium]
MDTSSVRTRMPPGGDRPAVRRHRAGPFLRVRLTNPRLLLPLAAGVVFLGLWEVFGRLSNPILFAPPSRIYQAFVDLTESGTLPAALAVTLNTLAVGYALSVVVGIALGVLIGRRQMLGRIVEPYLDAIYATPRVVIVPLVIVWFGIGYSGRLFIVFLGTVIPIALNTAIGVRQARPDLIEVARSFGVSERQLVRHVIVPGAIPYIVAGLRIGAGRALLGVVIAEIFLDLTGVGGIIATGAAFLHTADMLAGVVVFAVLGIVFLSGLTLLEKRVSPWRGQDGH